jgi:hypothetical protein
MVQLGLVRIDLIVVYGLIGRLQHGVEDKSKLSSVAPTIGALEDLQERWKDDYAANTALRNIFRVCED